MTTKPDNSTESIPSHDSRAQERITTFWTTVAPFYESDPDNVPSPDSSEYLKWSRAIEKLLPTAPADVLDVGTGTGFVATIASRLGHRTTGVDLSPGMLSEARMHAERCGLATRFEIGDAVNPPFEPTSFDAIVCRHLLWTLREPRVAISNWLRLLRPNGRVIVIDGFWFAQSRPEDEFELFKHHYDDRIREALPAMHWDRTEQVSDLLTSSGLVDVAVMDLTQLNLLDTNQANPKLWFIVTGRRVPSESA
jgi:ubiquinone/menaquinone biosynthesis C-methylase UbiE